MLDLLKALCRLNGTSGRENEIRAFVIEHLNGLPYTADALGNLTVEVPGRQRAKNRVMLAAHMDEVGVIATFIKEDGGICFTTVGSVRPGVLAGRAVRFENGTVGVIGLPPVHLCKKDEKLKLPEVSALTIDIGCDSAEETLALVRPGDTAVFESDYVEMGSRILSKALDDRVGVAILLDMIRCGVEYDTVFCFHVQEEVGLRGAAASAFRVQPDYALVLEATTAADLLDVPPEKRVCLLGQGAAVSFMDRATVYDKALYDRAMALAKAQGVAAQPKTAVAGGNDAGAIHKSRGGVRTLTLSVPCRYIHSPSCVCDTRDVLAVRKLAQLLSAEMANA